MSQLPNCQSGLLTGLRSWNREGCFKRQRAILGPCPGLPRIRWSLASATPTLHDQPDSTQLNECKGYRSTVLPGHPPPPHLFRSHQKSHVLKHMGMGWRNSTLAPEDLPLPPPKTANTIYLLPSHMYSLISGWQLHLIGSLVFCFVCFL